MSLFNKHWRHCLSMQMASNLLYVLENSAYFSCKLATYVRYLSNRVLHLVEHDTFCIGRSFISLWSNAVAY